MAGNIGVDGTQVKGEQDMAANEIEGTQDVMGKETEAMNGSGNKASEDGRENLFQDAGNGEGEGTATGMDEAEGAGMDEEAGCAGEPDGQEERDEEGCDAEGLEESEAQGEGKKGFFSKKKEKKNKQEEKIAELTDRLQRQLAEFDNFRKRTEKEKAQMFEIGAKSVIEKILPVVDNIERGLAAVPEEKSEDPFVQGMDKIYKQLMTELEGLGVQPIEAVGTEFNPDFHNAVMQVESQEYGSGIVAQELQKGYLYRDSVVRHSMVSVVE